MWSSRILAQRAAGRGSLARAIRLSAIRCPPIRAAADKFGADRQTEARAFASDGFAAVARFAGALAAVCCACGAPKQPDPGPDADSGVGSFLDAMPDAAPDSSPDVQPADGPAQADAPPPDNPPPPDTPKDAAEIDVPEGKALWLHSYPAVEEANAATASGGAVVAVGQQQGAAWIARVGPSGDEKWQKTAPGYPESSFHAVARLADGGLVAAGSARVPNKKHHAGLISRWSAQGELAGQWTVPGLAHHAAVSRGVAARPSGGWVAGFQLYDLVTNCDGDLGYPCTEDDRGVVRWYDQTGQVEQELVVSGKVTLGPGASYKANEVSAVVGWFNGHVAVATPNVEDTVRVYNDDAQLVQQWDGKLADAPSLLLADGTAWVVNHYQQAEHRAASGALLQTAGLALSDDIAAVVSMPGGVLLAGTGKFDSPNLQALAVGLGENAGLLYRHGLPFAGTGAWHAAADRANGVFLVGVRGSAGTHQAVIAAADWWGDVDGAAAGLCAAIAPDDCADGDACTQDDCAATTGCIHAPIQCDDANVCTADSCSSAGLCTHAPSGGACGTACAPGQCSGASGTCIIDVLPAGASCDDGFSCNGAETCDGQGQCTSPLGTPLGSIFTDSPAIGEKQQAAIAVNAGVVIGSAFSTWNSHLLRVSRLNLAGKVLAEWDQKLQGAVERVHFAAQADGRALLADARISQGLIFSAAWRGEVLPEGKLAWSNVLPWSDNVGPVLATAQGWLSVVEKGTGGIELHTLASGTGKAQTVLALPIAGADYLVAGSGGPLLMAATIDVAKIVQLDSSFAVKWQTAVKTDGIAIGVCPAAQGAVVLAAHGVASPGQLASLDVVRLNAAGNPIGGANWPGLGPRNLLVGCDGDGWLAVGFDMYAAKEAPVAPWWLARGLGQADQLAWQTAVPGLYAAELVAFTRLQDGRLFTVNKLASAYLPLQQFVRLFDPWGAANCGQAGACANLTLAACNDSNACTIDACAPSSGCQHVAIADGVACGLPGKVCLAGACK